MTKDLILNRKVKKSLEVSWKEGIPAAVMLGIMDYYLIPYALFLGAGTHQIGALVAIPHLLASIAQLFAVQVVRWAGSRLRFLSAGTFLQACLLIPMALLALRPIPYSVAILILLQALFKVIGNLIGTAWGSLMSDYLPPHRRGIYFGWRSQIVGAAGLLGIALGGSFLFLMRGIDPARGFFFLFLAASLCRLLSSYLMNGMVDLPLASKSDADFTFFMFVRRFKESNFVKYVLYVAGITFAVHLSAPYFSVYMLQNLKFNYLSYMAVHLSAVVTGLIAFPIWGRHADLAGNARILKTTSLMIPAIPLLWLFSENMFYLALVELFAGFVWGGFNLCATNFIYDAVSPEKRVRCLGYFNLIQGAAIFSGASLGGFWAGHLPSFGRSPLLALFLISGILRLAAHFLLSPNFQEVRQTAKKVSSLKLFFSVVGIRPLAGENQEWGIFPRLQTREAVAFFRRIQNWAGKKNG